MEATSLLRSESSATGETPAVSRFEIVKRMEFGQMAVSSKLSFLLWNISSLVNPSIFLYIQELFFSRWGQVFFYVALIVRHSCHAYFRNVFGRENDCVLTFLSTQSYLFGDAAIYCTFVPRSLVGFVFGTNPPLWAFDAFLALFVVLIVPFWCVSL